MTAVLVWLSALCLVSTLALLRRARAHRRRAQPYRQAAAWIEAHNAWGLAARDSVYQRIAGSPYRGAIARELRRPPERYFGTEECGGPFGSTFDVATLNLANELNGELWRAYSISHRIEAAMQLERVLARWDAEGRPGRPPLPAIGPRLPVRICLD